MYERYHAASALTPVVAVTGSTSVAINVNPGASVSGNHTSAVPFPVLSVEQSSTITNSGTVNLSGGGGSGTNRGAAMLGNNNSNNLTNGTGATISTTGAFIGPILVVRTGISTRYYRGLISRLQKTPSVATAIISVDAALRLRWRPATRLC